MAGGAAMAAGGTILTLDGAQQWLDTNQQGITVEGLTTFPGYDTLHTERNGTLTGMPSLNATTGLVWYHTRHGGFIATTEAEH